MLSNDTQQRAWEFLKNVNSTPENINKPAVIDGKKTWTFAEMFQEWERYAAMFSALHMTEEDRSRVMVLTTCSSQSLFINYGLDMTGAVATFHHKVAALTVDLLRPIVEEEKITDIIFWDALFQPKALNELERLREELGIRNIIAFHCDLPDTVFPLKLRLGNRLLPAAYKKVAGLQFLEEELKKYGNHPVSYAKADGNELSLITHTSGTSSGLPKLIPFTDRNRNAMARQFDNFGFPEGDQPKNALYYVIPSAAYGALNNIHTLLYKGCSMICTHAAFVMPECYGKLVKHYKPNLLFVIPHFMDTLLHCKERDELDFSKLWYIAIGGSKIPLAKMQEYIHFLKERGCPSTPYNGYGLSETGGSCSLDNVCTRENSIGKPMDGVEVCVYDSEKDECRSFADAPTQGELYVSSEASSSGIIDGREVFPSKMFAGKRYVATKDLAYLETDGTISMIGRNSRGFQNWYCFNVYPEVDEASLSSDERINACVMCPEYSDKLHGNLIKLYLELGTKTSGEKDFIHDLIWGKYTAKKLIAIPDIVVIADEIPINVLSKIDVHKVMEEGLPGRRYRIKPIGGANVTAIEVIADGQNQTEARR